MDDTTFGKLSEINEALVDHLQSLLTKQDLDALSTLVPIVDKLTTILIEIRQSRKCAPN
jgi:hypothetical protein